MKTKKVLVNSLIYISGITTLLAVPLSSSAYIQSLSITGMQANSDIFMQATDADADSTETENKSSAEAKKASAEKEKQKKLCDLARKNLDLLNKNKEERSFKTSDGKLVKYTPQELKKIISDNETVEKENCK